VTGASAFETLADAYDAWFDAHPALYESELQAVRAVLPEKTGAWVEIGVGTGRFASRLGIETGIEPAAAMAELARRRGVRVLAGTAEDVPLDDASVQAAFLITTLCFVRDINRSFSEMRRILVRGGAVVVAFLPRESPLGRRILGDGGRDPFFREARLLSTAEVLAAMTCADLRVERIVQTLTDPAGVERMEAPSDGFDRGSFVVIRGSVPWSDMKGSTQS
jgi:ubiquinone/menaquinone biosynthesis C-methylase UbiE